MLVLAKDDTTEVHLFLEDDNVESATPFFEGLKLAGLQVLPISKLSEVLTSLDSSFKISIDGVSCSQLAYKCLTSGNQNRVKELSGASAPVSKLKIIKNEKEVAGLRNALTRESASLISTYAKIRGLISNENSSF